ncbi:NAD(P)H-dependent glycerol-3-phosphate dehydrogenase [Candidatus Kinetoplastidibacterium galati]|uniref:Glycerol-3-phosphate dehydrogenase [NAD(P)+] n=1 Tax=Candidatus Kinetoplastidibacterium galati TCC219 TaxID=1208921 RepID=M1MC00_9PROT|nr:glycerol-3-phosphate dehydrogenase (NAD(P)+) [Candidatus Kinetoplastibacterium galatii TCC219]
MNDQKHLKPADNHKDKQEVCARYNKTNVLILGSGSWGTALAIASSKKNNTCLWSRNLEQTNNMLVYRENRVHLPGVKFNDDLLITNNMDHALDFVIADNTQPLIITGVPVSGVSETCSLLSRYSNYIPQNIPVIWTCKGFEPDTSNLIHEIIQRDLRSSKFTHGILSGPSFASEVALDLPTALTIASDSSNLCNIAIDALHNNKLRIYSSSDIIGVEVGGALKNIISIACGISDGLKLGDNARAALITRGLLEIRRFGVSLGSINETFYGLSGLGDLVLTATSNLSRNRNIGIKIGHGNPIAEILNSKITAEGVRCALSVRARARNMNLILPIIEAVCSILFEQTNPMDAVATLLEREARQE